MAAVTTFLDTDRRLGRAAVLLGSENGKYPSGNSLLVTGTEAAVLIDPSVTIADRGGVPATVDRVLVSHAHEDHLAGVFLFPDAAVHMHHDDVQALHSLDGFMEVYGFPPEVEQTWRHDVVEKFHWVARPDATGFADGHTFALGETRVEVVHLPGHTRGHCGFLVEPEGVFFVADIDLSGFGPYYGDHWSDLGDFEKAIERCREIDARWYVTSHHKGLIEGREAFVRQLDAFAAVIGSRENALLEFLAEPRTIDDIVSHRFVYRPGVKMLWVDIAERRSMRMHLTRLLAGGAVAETEPGRYRRAA